MDIVGIFVVALVFVGAIIALKDKSSDYDERQVAVMGKGYQIAVFAMAGLMGLGSVIYDEPAALPVSAADYMFLTLVTGAAIFMVYDVWHGAYFRVHEKNARTAGILFAITGALNFVLALQDGELWGIAFGLCFLAVGVTILVRLALDAHEAAAEDAGEGGDPGEGGTSGEGDNPGEGDAE